MLPNAMHQKFEVTNASWIQRTQVLVPLNVNQILKWQVVILCEGF